MAEQASNQQGGNVIEMSYIVRPEIKDIISENGIMNKKSSIEMIKFYSQNMKPHVVQRAIWTIKCLKHNLAWDSKRHENSLFR